MWLYKQSLPPQAKILTGCEGSLCLYSDTLQGIGFLTQVLFNKPGFLLVAYLVWKMLVFGSACYCLSVRKQSSTSQNYEHSGMDCIRSAGWCDR